MYCLNAFGPVHRSIIQPTTSVRERYSRNSDRNRHHQHEHRRYPTPQDHRRAPYDRAGHTAQNDCVVETLGS